MTMRGLRLAAASTATAVALGFGAGCSENTDVPLAKEGPAVTAEAPKTPPPSAAGKQGSAPPKGGGSPSQSPQSFSK